MAAVDGEPAVTDPAAQPARSGVTAFLVGLGIFLSRVAGLIRERVLATYKRTRPDATPWDLFIAITTEPTRLMSIRLAERKADAGAAPVFLYQFTWRSDFMGGLFKAAHALEIPFVFDNVAGVPLCGERPDRGELARLMSETWLAFARSGDPNHSGLPAWRPYTRERRDTMLLDVPPRAAQAPRQEELDAWRGVELRRV